MTIETARSDLASAAPCFVVFVALMSSLMALTALSIDIMLPAFPDFEAGFLLTDPNAPQLVVTYYLVGFALGQTVVGPLSDRFGRRPTLLFGLGVYALATLACLFAPNFGALLAARLVQGAANAAPRVVSIAVVRDIYAGRRMAEVMSFIVIVFTIAPILAPLIGSGLLLLGGWRWIFGFLALVSVAIASAIAMVLPETRPPDAREGFSIRWVGQAYATTLSTPQTLGYTLATGCVLGAVMGYVNASQQIFEEVYGVGEWFPVLFGVVALALALAAFINIRLVMALGMRRISHAALIGMILVASAHLGLSLAFGPPPLPIFIGLLSVAMFFFGLLMPNFNAIAMEPMGEIAGTASSFVGAVTTAMAAILGWAVGQSFDGSVVPVLAGYAGFGAAAFALVAITERGRLFGAGGA